MPPMRTTSPLSSCMSISSLFSFVPLREPRRALEAALLVLHGFDDAVVSTGPVVLEDEDRCRPNDRWPVRRADRSACVPAGFEPR